MIENQMEKKMDAHLRVFNNFMYPWDSTLCMCPEP